MKMNDRIYEETGEDIECTIDIKTSTRKALRMLKYRNWDSFNDIIVRLLLYWEGSGTKEQLERGIERYPEPKEEVMKDANNKSRWN